MKRRQLFSILILAGVSVALSGSAAWSQTTPAPGKGQTQTKDGKGERSGEEKMKARGAQKPGRMGKSGAENTGAKDSLGERWATQDVKKAQEGLKNKGHNPGSMDGVIGPQTRQAIRAFQNANGLKVTGRLDSETAEKLGIEKASASGASSQGSASMGKGQDLPMQKEPAAPMRK
jgi:peptidoglycan hydrolase-like protein with peptidoglycan-binding domain